MLQYDSYKQMISLIRTNNKQSSSVDKGWTRDIMGLT